MSTPTPALEPEVTHESERVRKVGDEWVASYQPKDDWGNPIGPLQTFKDKTLQKVTEKVAAAHENSSVSLYKARKANKLGGLLEPDQEQPIQTFEEKPLTADERVRIAEELKNPETAPEAAKALLEAMLGAPIDTIRRTLQATETSQRLGFVRDAIQIFIGNHPEYIPSESNRDIIVKYLEKKNLPVTVNNLEIAFDDLTQDNLLLLRAPEPTRTEVTPEPVEPEPISPEPTELETAPLSEPAIPAPTTQTAPISTEPAVVRPRTSSSGLSSRSSSVSQTPTVPKTKGTTIQEIRNMPTEEYQRRLREVPGFAKLVDELMA